MDLNFATRKILNGTVYRPKTSYVYSCLVLKEIHLSGFEEEEHFYYLFSEGNPKSPMFSLYEIQVCAFTIAK